MQVFYYRKICAECYALKKILGHRNDEVKIKLYTYLNTPLILIYKEITLLVLIV